MSRRRTQGPVVAAMVLGWLALAAPAGAHGRHNGLIGFQSDRGPADLPYRQLYAMEPDGTGIRPLLPAFDTSFDLAWSPDGRRFAFSSILDVGYFEVFTARADGTGVRRLTNDADDVHDGGPVWDPRAPGLLFVSDREATEALPNQFDLFRLSLADPADVVDLTRNDANDCACYDPFDVFAQASYSPDGRRIAFTSDLAEPGRNADVYVMRRDGTHVRRLTTAPGIDGEPDWSPDGRTIAFQSDRDGDLEIFVMNARGRHVEQLTDNTTADLQPDWSPDGRSMAFASNRSGADDIWVMAADGTDPRNLTRDAASDERPDWQAAPRPHDR